MRKRYIIENSFIRETCFCSISKLYLPIRSAFRANGARCSRDYEKTNSITVAHFTTSLFGAVPVDVTHSLTHCVPWNGVVVVTASGSRLWNGAASPSGCGGRGFSHTPRRNPMTMLRNDAVEDRSTDRMIRTVRNVKPRSGRFMRSCRQLHVRREPQPSSPRTDPLRLKPRKAPWG